MSSDRHSEQEIQSELQRIFDRISDAFFAVDEDFRFTHVNERAEQLIQHSEEELRGETLWDVIPSASEIEEVRKAFKTASNSQEAVSIEFYHDGLDMWIEGNLYPSETGISVYFRDVTERREYEQKLEESNERLEQFAYAASHDLQEPLRMVSSYLQLIEGRYGDGLDEDGREFLEFAVDGADRMRDMIDGLLEYSRVESQGEAFEPVELDDVLGDVRESLRMKVDENDAEISAGDLPRVEGDHGQLRQLFQNLLDNAIEYSGDEPPRIHVSAERAADRWIVSVRDEGVGIDPSDTDRIFNVFQTLHTPDQRGGTGIGLALCQRIVERHGGDIWVDSEPGEGSTFSFTLPTVGDDDE
jgi:PAS domain S-box-containing protein